MRSVSVLDIFEKVAKFTSKIFLGLLFFTPSILELIRFLEGAELAERPVSSSPPRCAASVYERGGAWRGGAERLSEPAPVLSSRHPQSRDKSFAPKFLMILF